MASARALAHLKLAVTADVSRAVLDTDSKLSLALTHKLTQLKLAIKRAKYKHDASSGTLSPLQYNVAHKSLQLGKLVLIFQTA